MRLISARVTLLTTIVLMLIAMPIGAIQAAIDPGLASIILLDQDFDDTALFVEGVSLTQKMSLIVAGIPAKGPGSSPSAIILSTNSACARAASSVSVTKACTRSASSLVSGPLSNSPGRPSTCLIL